MNFSCPQCSQRFEADDDMVGQAVTCPVCSAKLLVPGATANKTREEKQSTPSVWKRMGRRVADWFGEKMGTFVVFGFALNGIAGILSSLVVLRTRSYWADSSALTGPLLLGSGVLEGCLMWLLFTKFESEANDFGFRLFLVGIVGTILPIVTGVFRTWVCFG